MPGRCSLFVLLALASCDFEHGSIIADAPVDEPGDIGNSDEDGDGVADATDNCRAVANADQRDHDGDQRGDVCDACPHVNAPTDTDTDGDLIGDACDPRPTTAGDRLVLWEGFYDTAALAAWTQYPTQGTWTVQMGGAVQASSSAGDRTLSLPMTLQRLYMATSFEIGARGTGATLGLCASVVPAQRYYCCTVRQTGPNIQATSYAAGMINETQLAPWPGTFATGDRIQLVQNMSTNNRCDAAQGAVTATRGANVATTGGQLQLYTSSAGASFDYVFIVEVGP